MSVNWKPAPKLSGDFRLGRSFSTLLDAKADNILLIKVAFGWSR